MSSDTTPWDKAEEAEVAEVVTDEEVVTETDLSLAAQLSSQRKIHDRIKKES